MRPCFSRKFLTTSTEEKPITDCKQPFNRLMLVIAINVHKVPNTWTTTEHILDPCSLEFWIMWLIREINSNQHLFPSPKPKYTCRSIYICLLLLSINVCAAVLSNSMPTFKLGRRINFRFMWCQIHQIFFKLNRTRQIIARYRHFVAYSLIHVYFLSKKHVLLRINIDLCQCNVCFAQKVSDVLRQNHRICFYIAKAKICKNLNELGA